MLSDIKEFYGLSKEFRHVGYFESEHHAQILKEMIATIKSGRLVALSGSVGSGKTVTLKRIQEILEQENEVLVSKSLSVDKERVNLGTLIMALFYDLAIDKDFKIPTQPEKRERKLRELIRRRHKTVALFVDEAHDLHSKTLVGLKRLIEVVRDGDGILSVVLAGHPKLKNDLRRPTMEEIGSRATVFVFEGVKGDKKAYIDWLLDNCLKKKVTQADIFTNDAIDMLTERLATPLQIEHYATLAIEEGYKIGQKPITAELIESVLAKDLDDLEPRLTRQGYKVKTLADLLNVRPAEIRSFLRGQLAESRTQELKNEMLAVGIMI